LTGRPVHGHRRFLLHWLAAALLLVLAVGAFNVVVDPYGIFRLVDRPGLNAIKPAATTRGGMAKAIGVQREQPGALVLGNSRAEIAFDPDHPGWPPEARPVFNLSVAATGPTTTLRYFQHALAAADASGKPIRVVVWGIDFMDFLVPDNASPDAPPPVVEGQRLLGGPGTDKPATAASVQRLKDWATASLTMRGFTDSVQTLAAQRDPFAVDQTRLGFNPFREYVRITRDEGAWGVFNQKNATYLNIFSNKPMGLFDTRGDASYELDALREIMRLCRQRNIALHLVMYPYHAHFLEAIRITGHEPGMETWKRLIVKIVADEARSTGRPPVPVWDFAGINAWTTEAVPQRGDRSTTMQWYWEAGHFKRALGDRMLDQVLGLRPADPDFGVLLEAGNVEQRINDFRAAQQRYRREHADDVRQLERLAAP